jgi:diketogulonate reductase-like aldo/keto reductase
MESRYPEVQKLLYAVMLVKKKLLHYCEAHHIQVVNLSGLGEVVRYRNATG